MTKEKRKSGCWIIAIVGALLLLAGGGFAFKLFEPVFAYNTGWAAFEPEENAPSSFETFDENFTSASAGAARILAEARQSGRHPGISVAIGIEGQDVWRGAVGYADLAERTPLTLDHAFRLGSTSKPLAAVAVGTLMDEGRLELGTPMREIDPTLPAKFERITLGQAMSHRAGIRNYGLCFCFPAWEHLNSRSFETVRDSVEVIAQDDLLFAPGEGYAYTSLGYNLAGLAVAKAGDGSFGSVLRDRVLGPLAMDHTWLEDGERPRGPTATWYDVEQRGTKPAWPVDQSIRWPSGGIISTPSDMVRFGSAILDDSLLSDETRAELLAIPEGGRRDGGEIYAHGWRVFDWELENGEARLTWQHNGTSVGSRSIFIIFPETGLVLSIMTNKGGDSIDDLVPLANELVSIFLAEDAS